MEINLIYSDKKTLFKLVEKNSKVKIFIYKTKKKLKELYNFILQINQENISNYYQIQIEENQLKKFIKNKIIYFQKEQYLNDKVVVFRYSDKLLLKEIIIKNNY